MLQRLCITVGLVCLLPFVSPAFAASIYGDYVESRSADVYTGPCFANGEVGLTGNEATLAWHIRKGQWGGVTLDGLSVVAVARANATLGDPYHNPYPAVSILIIDAKADDVQQNALMSFAKAMGGRLLDDVRLVHFAPITMEVGEGQDHGSVHLRAGEMAEIQTRPLSDKDHYCGNEETYYPPLTELSHAMPAVAVSSRFVGKDLGVEWKIFNKRSAFVGSFSREVVLVTESH
jgi:hypothetical protein